MDESPTVRLRARIAKLHDGGLQDMKFWFAGAQKQDVTVDDLSAEVLRILDVHEKGTSNSDRTFLK